MAFRPKDGGVHGGKFVHSISFSGILSPGLGFGIGTASAVSQEAAAEGTRWCSELSYLLHYK
jgi:hypothetical protein